ncbi:MAG: TonB-dependent receptor [Planctomycetota bacterium]
MRRGLILLLSIAVLVPAAQAQEKETGTGGEDLESTIEAYADTTRLDETVVSATRTPRKQFDLPRVTTVVPIGQVQQQQPGHVVDVITRREAGIIMDIRTASTGDPIMRGFAGFNLLTLVDQNSLSTLWGEGGFGADDMYGKIDPETVERIEIVHGPSSVLYGSNALGGVINLITRTSPENFTDGETLVGFRTKGVYSSNTSGYRLRGEMWGATPEVKGLLGITYAEFHNGSSAEQELDPTNSEEFNLDLRTDWYLAPGQELSVSVLRTHRDPTVRYYRPTQENTNDRFSVALAWNVDTMAGETIEDFQWRVYFQHKQDERRWNDGTNREGYARTDTWSTDLQASSDLGGGHFLTYGVHASVDLGESADDEQFTFTSPPPTRADAPDTEWWNLAAFLLDEWEVTKHITLHGSARYDWFSFTSKETSSYQPADGDREADFFTDSIGALTGGLGVTWKPDDHWRVTGSWSRGFRQYAPNFGFRQLGNGVLVPNQLLDPVTSDNFELGFRTRYPSFDFEAVGYVTDINDWQALRPDTYDGSDWYDYNGNGVRDDNEDVISQQAVEGAYVYGFELRTAVYLSQILAGDPYGWSAWGSFAVNYGKVSDGEYFRHTMPPRALLGLRWDDPDRKRAGYVELITEIVGKYDRIPSDRVEKDLAYRRDPQDGSSPLLRSYGGVPGYTVWYLYAGLDVCENAKVTVGFENITNKKYRRAHSRMDALGFDFTVGLDLSF